MHSLFLKYLGIAFGIAFIILIFNVFSATGHVHGFWHGVSILFWLTLSPTIGMTLGALIRQWLMPDAIYTREGTFGLAKAKLFWAVGPQGIGWLLGALAVADKLA
ncbi:hypothetical protein ACOT1K_19690 [Providencia manganoxydans]|uniref:hypothetical protein n=1 Tax=Providencia manganoxydans TaxID=2923283 RepID=UPI003B9C91C6